MSNTTRLKQVTLHTFIIQNRMWRKNRKRIQTLRRPWWTVYFGSNDEFCYGVDLNRNFGFSWGGKFNATNIFKLNKSVLQIPPKHTVFHIFREIHFQRTDVLLSQIHHSIGSDVTACFRGWY